MVTVALLAALLAALLVLTTRQYMPVWLDLTSTGSAGLIGSVGSLGLVKVKVSLMVLPLPGLT